MTGPFEALGLPAGRDLTDDEVRAAWRRVAAATHPDRPDGGDLAAFAAAAAAYTVLRTQAGRGEALADLTAPRLAPRPATRVRLAALVRRGRPGRLIARLLAAAAAGTLAVVAVGWQPAAYSVIAGAVTWLAVEWRADLARPVMGRRG
jgi:hypothetical protein